MNLLLSEKQELEIDYYPKCGGIWLDEVNLIRLLKDWQMVKIVSEIKKETLIIIKEMMKKITSTNHLDIIRIKENPF